MCASYLLRRSGIVIGLIAELLEWQPDVIIQAGVGHRSQEVDVFMEAWPNVHLEGFEPHAKIYRDMEKVYPGKLHHFALGSEGSPSVPIYFKHNHKDGTSLFPGEGMDLEESTAKMTTLDSHYASRIPVIDIARELGATTQFLDKQVLLWLDCEGSELAVLQGGERFIVGVDVVNVELTSKPPRQGWCKPTDVHRWLVDHGFFRIWLHTQRTSAGQVDGIYVRPRLFRPEYCCCPCEVLRYEKGNQ